MGQTRVYKDLRYSFQRHESAFTLIEMQSSGFMLELFRLMMGSDHTHALIEFDGLINISSIMINSVQL